MEELETRFEKWMYVLKNLKRLDRLPDKLRERILQTKKTALADILAQATNPFRNLTAEDIIELFE